jgi:hypothetical protein
VNALIWNDHKAQLDFYTWLEMHAQERREQEIREFAKRYAEGKYGRVGVPFMHQSSAAHSSAIKFRYNDIVLDIHPGIQGFPRQLLAEIAIHEQLGMGDEPGDN